MHAQKLASKRRDIKEAMNQLKGNKEASSVHAVMSEISKKLQSSETFLRTSSFADDKKFDLAKTKAAIKESGKIIEKAASLHKKSTVFWSEC